MSLPISFMDVECYSNYFLVGFLDHLTARYRYFHMYPGQPLNKRAVSEMMNSLTNVTFNGMNYDTPMVSAALNGMDCEGLKKLSNSIINGGLRQWQTEQLHGVRVPRGWDHIDLQEPVPGVFVSLKKYGARLHSKRLQDLPIEHTAKIKPEEREGVIVPYNKNDLITLQDLWRFCTTPGKNIIEIRETIGKQYGMDLRSKSDAQMAEAVIKKLVEKHRGQPLTKAFVSPGTTFKYRPPAFIRFKTPYLQDLFNRICEADFITDHNGKVIAPDVLKAPVKFGHSVYTIGIGGIHSNEKSVSHVADENTIIRDIDATSFYPFLIAICGLSPDNMGNSFQVVYREWIDARVNAKRSGIETLAQILKIFLNGIFGKLGSSFSIVYAPDLLIQVTLTGQLVQLMAVESFETNDIPVVSANTDGIVVKIRKDQESLQRELVKQWEKATGFTTEETDYIGLFSRDINTYIALKPDGSHKAKGDLAPTKVDHDPTNWISRHAVIDYLKKGTPIAQTVMDCTDVREFISVRQANGGAFYESIGSSRYEDGEYLGKVVRWVYEVNGTRCIRTKKPNKKGNHNKVADTDGCLPLMLLPDELPKNLDYEKYIQEAHDILKLIGGYK